MASLFNTWLVFGCEENLFQAAKYEIQKPSTCRPTLFRCKFWVDVSRAFRLVDLLGVEPRWRHHNNKSARMSLLRDIWEFEEKRATRTKFVSQSRPALYFSQQLSATYNKCCCARSWSRKVKYAKHRPSTCNETMLRDKLSGFVSHISPPF